MSKPKNQRTKGNLPFVPKSSTSSTSAKTPSIQENLSPAQVSSLADKAIEKISDEQLTSIISSTPPHDFKVEECWQKAKLFEAAIEKITTELKQVENRQKELEIQKIQREVLKKELEEQRQKITEQQEDLKKQQTRSNARIATLAELERQLRERELNAEASFLEQNRAALAELETQTQELRKTREQLYKDIAQRQKQFDIQIAQKLTEIEQEISTKRQQIENEQQQVDTVRKHLRIEQRKLETERELLEEDKVALFEKIEQKAAARIEQQQVKIQELEERLKVSQQVREEFQEKLIQRTEADRRFGQKTPEEVLEDLETLRRDNAELEQKLALRLSESAVARLQDLEVQKEQWETEHFRLSTRVQELERNIIYNRIAVIELETLRDEKEALEASNNRLKAALLELKTDVNEAVTQSKDKSPFPECSRMDVEPSLQGEIPLCEHIPDLRQFAEDLRYRIALSPLMLDDNSEKRLYYSERDIRVFLGGLAMSHLHILQGISGTGKTSLPIAFSRAIGGEYELVEVQAGWRDRPDLIGYCNTFEGKFYETKFLKAIYKAQCPANKDRTFIIILDEMNLSRPEQYFADFLSKLEQDTPAIDLTPDLKPSPKLFQQGNTLPIPPNVWFIGTANQDETTLEFADKTYDRSHIMELQRNHETFRIPAQLEPRHPISYDALTKSFKNAQRRYADKASEAYQFLNETLAEFLERRFKVGWGNRLERQIKDFVPVVIAAGGSLGEATDHILATKILRKIRDRHDTPTSDLRKLKEELLAGWNLHHFKPEPKQSIEIIDTEIRRLEPGED
ncbi:hypothetical protein F7734_29995 [Scytonema sp. UIC 10036]|uniref:hypothetical protein n=1 Tax=Scytonema sp. UIC 10036 TaxID=2304196 RepID=UPI0012DA7BEC|nr:hypothetical protein [Scytonema sp. UIC 10036]MUG96346.1 hypothetical protein [Scytonema sp. UIC 10036]